MQQAGRIEAGMGQEQRDKHQTERRLVCTQQRVAMGEVVRLDLRVRIARTEIEDTT
jgi:hypothetical protein